MDVRQLMDRTFHHLNVHIKIELKDRNWRKEIFMKMNGVSIEFKPSRSIMVSRFDFLCDKKRKRKAKEEMAIVSQFAP